MKYKIIFILALFFTQTVLAQEDCADDPNCNCGQSNGITTNPDNPVNPDCPNKENTFDWRTETFSTPNYPNPNMTSPFFEDNNPIWMSYIWNSSNYNAPDFHPEDGWEIIKYDLNSFDHLYLVLYNKYSSIIRILAAVDDDQGGYQSMVVKLEYNPNGSEKVTGLLSPQQGRGQYMDEKSISMVTSTVEYSNSEFFFHVVDIPVEYDPCTCFFDDGTISISFDLVQSQTLTAYSRFIATNNNLANIQNGLGKPLNNRFLTSVYSKESSPNSGNYTNNAGTYIFKDWVEMNDYYVVNKNAKAELEEQLKKVENVKKAMDGISNIAGQLPSKKAKIAASALKELSGYVDYFSAPIKKKIAAASSKIEAAGGIVLTQGEMAITGNLQTNISLGNTITFDLPGRLNNNTRCDYSTYPLYDEVLGRFALLKKTTVDVGKILNEPNLTSRPPTSEANFSSQYRFKFSDYTSLLYKINPALNVVKENTKIYSWFFIKAKSLGNISYGLKNLEMMSSDSDVGGLTFASPMLPIECISSLTSEITSVHTNSHLQIEDIQLKVMVIYEFDQLNTDGVNNRAVQILTYPLDINAAADYNTMPSSPHYEKELNLSSQIFTTTQTVFALDKIIIDGSLTTSNGAVVEIIAPEIEITSNTQIGEGITLITRETPNACNQYNTIGEANNHQLEVFCKGDFYKSNEPLDLRRFRINRNSTDTEVSDDVLSIFEVVPNPVKDNLNLKLSLAENVNSSSLSIRDVTGKLVKEVFKNRHLSSGYLEESVNVSDLISGIYLITFSSEKFSKTIKVVKQ